jgi:G:T-mismatch repair DNA endonuclease (very short patch repair protein)
VYLVGFIIRIYHDARSSDCQIQERTYLFTGNDFDMHRLSLAGQPDVVTGDLRVLLVSPGGCFSWRIPYIYIHRQNRLPDIIRRDIIYAV